MRLFAERSEGQIVMCLKSGGGLQGGKWIISRHEGENHALTVNLYLYHLWRDKGFMSRLRYSEMFIGTYIPTYQGNTLRKSLHNHRCYFGIYFWGQILSRDQLLYRCMICAPMTSVTGGLRRRGGVMHQTRLIGLKGNQQVLLHNHARSPSTASKWFPEPFGRASSRDQELLHKGKHAVWQLTSGSSRVSGICHQSYQCFSMLNVSV